MGGKKDTRQAFEQVENNLLKQLYTNARSLLEAGTVSPLLRSQVWSPSSPLSRKSRFLIIPPSRTLTTLQLRLRYRSSRRSTVMNTTDKTPSLSRRLRMEKTPLPRMALPTIALLTI